MHLEDHADLIAVLQVLADAGKVDDHPDTEVDQLLAGPNAGKLQQLRRIESPA